MEQVINRATLVMHKYSNVGSKGTDYLNIGCAYHQIIQRININIMTKH